MVDKRIKALHDEVKEHPFWKTLSNDFHADCVDKLKELIKLFIGQFSADDIMKCPQAVIILELMHNVFDSMIKAKLMPKYYHKTAMEINGFGNYIIALQTVLQLIHYYIDGISDEDVLIGYDPQFVFDEEKKDYVDCILKRTYTAKSNGDGTFRLVEIIKKSDVDELLKLNEEIAVGYAKLVEHFTKHGQKEYAEYNLKNAQYYSGKCEDLKNNKQKYYVIK